MKRLCATLVLTTFSVATAFATTYVRVEKDGTKTYSDRPIPGGQPVDLQPAQTYASPPAPSNTNRDLPPEQQALQNMGDPFRYERCTLLPEKDRTFTNPESVPISAILQPPLRPDDRAELTLDGQRVGNPNALSYVITPVDRGSHTISIVVRDSYGRPLCTASSTFHVFRPSLNSPARKPRPRG